MSKRIFTDEQRLLLSGNPHVQRCSKKSITCRKDFKLKAIQQYYNEDLSVSDIFRQAGLDPAVIGREQPKRLLGAWIKTYKSKGVAGLAEARGKNGFRGRPKTKGISDADRIKRLEIQVAYLKAENDFLAKLRAKRRE